MSALPRLLQANLLLAGLLQAPARADQPFDVFLAGVRADAIGSGIAASTVDRAFAGLRPNAKVLELDSHPPERTQSWERYRASRVSDARVAAGRQAMQANRDALAAIGRRTGVDPAIVVAIWGVETNYGGYTGGFSVIEALATLAADGRRDGYFRRELLEALRILDAGDIALPRMTGSYAGAMGQPQFMPSSYRDYAVSFDGSARRDIWDNRNDALASIANYLLRSGWRAGEPWGHELRTPDAGADGTLLQPDGPGGAAFVVSPNFAVIRLYNHSDLYALSVGVLADRIRSGPTP